MPGGNNIETSTQSMELVYVGNFVEWFFKTIIEAEREDMGFGIPGKPANAKDNAADSCGFDEGATIHFNRLFGAYNLRLTIDN